MTDVIKPTPTIEIKVVSTEGCTGAPPTVERMRETAVAMQLKIALGEVVVATQAEADAVRMLGSPTVQINGLDLDPSRRGETHYGFT